MCKNTIDLARIRRMRFEDLKTDDELSILDFDEFGHARPLVRIREREEEALGVKDMTPEAQELLRQLQPGLARSLGLFPTLRIVNDNAQET